MVCDTGTAEGTMDAGGNSELKLAFFGNCDISGLSATVTCSTMDPGTGDGGVRLSLLQGTTDEGTVNLNPNFRCDMAVSGICTITIDAGPTGIDLPDATSSADIEEHAFEVNVNMPATRSGSSLCGPASGTANWAGLYEEVP
jgi:hypothetical protein